MTEYINIQSLYLLLKFKSSMFYRLYIAYSNLVWRYVVDDMWTVQQWSNCDALRVFVLWYWTKRFSQSDNRRLHISSRRWFDMIRWAANCSSHLGSKQHCLWARTLLLAALWLKRSAVKCFKVQENVKNSFLTWRLVWNKTRSSSRSSTTCISGRDWAGKVILGERRQSPLCGFHPH